MLRVLDARVPADRAAWAAFHARWPHREPHAHPVYVDLFAGPTDRPLAALFEDAGGSVLYPFISRPIDAAHLAAVVPGARDLITAYGYGGPFVVGTPDAARFWAELDAWARDELVVSEVVRFSLDPDAVLRFPGVREQRLVNVVVDLASTEDELWRGFEHKVRKNVNRARQAGVTVTIERDGRGLDDFLAIYTATMDRREAKRSFYFDRAFFTRLVEEMPGQLVFAHARHGGRVVSTELVLLSATAAYSYLGGTDAAAFELRPNDLLKLEIMRWARAAGLREFVLGGGYAPDDGIFRYKKAFAPHGMRPFYIGMRVHDRARYDALCAAHEAHARAIDPAWSPSETFFPAYRADLSG